MSRAQHERWASERTNTVAAPVRSRGRHLSNGDDEAQVFQHNTWDDVALTDAEIATAEQVVSSQPMATAELVDTCRREASAKWEQHYRENLRNYHDRRWLLNEYPTLLQSANGDPDAALDILETGCGVGNTLLPLLTLSPRVNALGCDHARCAVEWANERLEREGCERRGRAFCWDIGLPPPANQLPSSGVDTVLAIFTLSALPPENVGAAFAHLAKSMKPGGQLLLRDYGRLDLKQLKFARSAAGRLGISSDGCEWYARGDGTTALFFTTEALTAHATSAGLEVLDVHYDKRLVVNRADKVRMHRVWVVAHLRKPQLLSATANGASTTLPLTPAAATRGDRPAGCSSSAFPPFRWGVAALVLLVSLLAARFLDPWLPTPSGGGDSSGGGGSGGAAAQRADLEVGFCDSNGRGFYRTQPADQLERWQTPYDNGTHLVIDWRNDRRVSGRNVSKYYVHVQTSLPVLNLFVGTFGGFPQDVCAPGGSKARNAVATEGGSTCSPYAVFAHRVPRTTAFEIPAALRKLAKWDITVVVRGYGAHAPMGGGRHQEGARAQPCTWWCHVYRKPQAPPENPPAGAPASDRPRTTEVRRRPNALAAAVARAVRWIGARLGLAAGRQPVPERKVRARYEKRQSANR